MDTGCARCNWVEMPVKEHTLKLVLLYVQPRYVCARGKGQLARTRFSTQQTAVLYILGR